MRDEPRCGDCGHDRFWHQPETHESAFGAIVTADGSTYLTHVHGRCSHIDRSPYHTGRPCYCRMFIPDEFPRVSEFLGHKLRREIEDLVGHRPRRREVPPWILADLIMPWQNFEPGDRVDVFYEGNRHVFLVGADGQFVAVPT